MAIKKRYSNPLGRGLDALISTEAVRPQGSSTISEISIEQIEANPNQPRREFDEEALNEPANSIREIGCDRLTTTDFRLLPANAAGEHRR